MENLRKTAITIWHSKNNAGEGYAVGEVDSNIDELPLGRVELVSSETNGVAVYRTADGMTIVGDSHGPWAVDVSLEELASL